MEPIKGVTYYINLGFNFIGTKTEKVMGTGIYLGEFTTVGTWYMFALDKTDDVYGVTYDALLKGDKNDPMLKTINAYYNGSPLRGDIKYYSRQIDDIIGVTSLKEKHKTILNNLYE